MRMAVARIITFETFECDAMKHVCSDHLYYKIYYLWLIQ